MYPRYGSHRMLCGCRGESKGIVLVRLELMRLPVTCPDSWSAWQGAKCVAWRLSANLVSGKMNGLV